METAVDFNIQLYFQHQIRFGHGFFDHGNPVLLDLLETGHQARRVIAFLDSGLVGFDPALAQRVATYFEGRAGLEFKACVEIKGGEASKSDDACYLRILREIEAAGIDRHSYVLAIGGGALLDVVGLAAATAHRGVRLVRFPTTSLAQDDSGVGVKNGINAFGKKNWQGTFAVPYAVLNDFDLLHLQPEKQRRDGLVEAVKVAAVKDAAFFAWIESKVDRLSQLDRATVEECVQRSALWHARHIAEGGDPFETGSSRPLDFGHWAAHKLEQLTDYELSHAEAVGIGVALDVTYSVLSGRLAREEGERILAVLESLKMRTWHPALTWNDAQGVPLVRRGLEEFREHLGGRLTVLFLEGIGRPVDVNEVDFGLMLQAMATLKMRQPCD